MKKLIMALMLLTVVGLLLADDLPQYTQTYTEATQPMNSIRYRNPDRITPDWTFNANPTNLMTSYYDYMIGSYNSNPMRLVSPAQGGGYFLTYHAKRTATGTRRVFQNFIDNNNVIMINNELTPVQTNEGYPSVAIDPLSSKPLYVWHANSDTDTQYEIQGAWDAFLGDFPPIPGIITDPFNTINNPITLTDPNNVTTTDNEFIWPMVQIGPSPVAGMRRAYVMGRNSVSHVSNTNPSENVYIAYADFNANMIETGQTLTWSYTSIPELNAWNNATVTYRRPNSTLCVGNDGKVFVVGYHSASLISDDSPVDENDIDIFMNSNYGAGTWQHLTSNSQIVTGNPPTNFGNGPGYFVDADGIPYANNEIFWKLINSGHHNATVDNNGVVHMIGMWSLTNVDEMYYPYLNVMNELTFNSNTSVFGFREIYPVAGNSSDNLLWKPWDDDGNSTVDQYDMDGNPVLTQDWNFPYWDSTSHDNAMCFHYNNQKITEPNASGQMAAVWQNSNRARLYNLYPDSYPELAPFASRSEIYISVSPNYGQDWSDPIIINSVETPGFTDNHPMWVYPADKIQSNGSMGKLGLMYYADNSWGSYILTPPIGQNDGGIVKYMALNIDFSDLNPTGITGTVTRSDNNQPISNATVTIGTNTATTNVNGNYTLMIAAGVYNATASAVGYAPQTVSEINVVNSLLTTANFSLEPLPTVLVFGSVTGGSPAVALSGATISLTGIQTNTVNTDATGAFSITNVIANQTYQYSVSLPWFETVTGTITVGAENFIMDNIHLNEAVIPVNNVIANIVNDNNSVFINWINPIGRSIASLSSSSRDRDRTFLGCQIWRLTSGQENNEATWTLLASATSDFYTDDGWASLLPGTYKYAVKAHYTNDVCSAPAFSNNINRYTNGTLSGVIRDLSNYPLYEATVTLTEVTPSGHGPYTGLSLSSGHYSIPNVWYGSYNVTCTKAGYQPFAQSEIFITANQISTYNIVLADSLFVPRNVLAETNQQNTIAAVTWEHPRTDATRILQGYMVWRMLAADEGTPASWTQLTINAISTLYYPDTNWATLASGTYKYAVKALYSGSYLSAPTISPALEKVVANPNDSNQSARIPSLNCYPNPFGTCTTIAVHIPKSDNVVLKIYNVKGALVRTLINSRQNSGLQDITWDGKDDQGKTCSGGLYFCRLNTGKHHLQTKLILMP